MFQCGGCQAQLVQVSQILISSVSVISYSEEAVSLSLMLTVKPFSTLSL